MANHASHIERYWAYHIFTTTNYKAKCYRLRQWKYYYTISYEERYKPERINL